MPRDNDSNADSSRRNIPQTGELVIAQISKIMPYGAYCKLPEYNNLEVFLPIKEISSGWIKNIHEFVHEGQKAVCKVIYFDRERQTIDVSLKKVTPKDAKQKLGDFNLEKRLGSLFMQAVRVSGLEAQKAEMTAAVAEEFKTYTNLVRSASANDAQYESSRLPKKLKAAITKLIETSKKKKRYVVSYVMKLTTFNTMSGATELRKLLSSIKEKGIDVRYVSAPKYHLVAEGKDYADAESKIKGAVEIVNSTFKKGTFEIEKERLKREKEDIMQNI